MQDTTGKHISEWKPVSELRPVEKDISYFGYKKEYIQAHRVKETKRYHCASSAGGINFFEPIEVKSENGIVYYRENDNHVHRVVPEYFDTQFGRFNNHNNGEFLSWLGKATYDGPPKKGQKNNSTFEGNAYYISGNFCDMFDCGDYCYVVANLMHMAVGDFKIVRIDRGLTAVTLYTNAQEEGYLGLEYLGRFKNGKGHVLIVSGSTHPNWSQPGKPFLKKTIIFQIDKYGRFSKIRDWQMRIASSNSVDSILHKAFIDVSRKGTRAAAVTECVVVAGGCPNFKTVTLDRPFIYAIIHQATALPVFCGIVNDISEEQ